ncbi:winged helix-turn-helix domain-containing protein [Capillibacterium thermochitinicola]|uniref:Response regulator transcription factor n=1 Tax=Capillibacterium thermochitinicola TaxID=2699427 RepID=A0A8J6LHW2_9FIRM|nr:response regulator transcription factor [Capillibacterium thermochitinicola]
MSKERVLIIEDEPNIIELVAYNLEKEGWLVSKAQTGEEGWEKIQAEHPDIILLDLMLPGIDGMEICRRTRQNKLTRDIPIIILTAKAEEADRVLGLESGADDYVTKPFSPRELIARIRAVLRRADKNFSEVEEKEMLVLGPIKMDLRQHKVLVHDNEIELTPKEFDLLHLLLSHPGRAFSREYLLENLWGYEFFGDTRTVDVHVRRLRQKIEDNPAQPYWLETVRGVGYRIREE